MLIIAQAVKNSPRFVEPKVSLLYLQGSNNGSSLEHLNFISIFKR
jgi:hypothetical protein